MALLEDPSLFLADFGVTVVAGAVSGLGILDMPGEVLISDAVISTDYALRCRSSEFGGLMYGDEVTVSGVSYQVRETRLIDDGTFCEISLSRLDPGVSAPGRDPREALNLDDLGDVSLTDELEPGEALVYNGTNWTDQHVDAADLAGNIDGGTFN